MRQRRISRRRQPLGGAAGDVGAGSVCGSCATGPRSAAPIELPVAVGVEPVADLLPRRRWSRGDTREGASARSRPRMGPGVGVASGPGTSWPGRLAYDAATRAWMTLHRRHGGAVSRPARFGRAARCCSSAEWMPSTIGRAATMTRPPSSPQPWPSPSHEHCGACAVDGRSCPFPNRRSPPPESAPKLIQDFCPVIRA